jgi:hypothetical protein
MPCLAFASLIDEILVSALLQCKLVSPMAGNFLTAALDDFIITVI